MLTKQQRNIVYKALLKAVVKDPSVTHGICYYLACLNLPNMPYEWKNTFIAKRIQLLPELRRHKPKSLHYQLFWAPLDSKGWKKRIGWIIECITKTQ